MHICKLYGNISRAREIPVAYGALFTGVPKQGEEARHLSAVV